MSLVWADWTACARSWRVRVWGMWPTWSLTTRGHEHNACMPCWQSDSQRILRSTNRMSNRLMSGRHWVERKMTFSFMTGLLPVVLRLHFVTQTKSKYSLLTTLFISLVIRCGRLTHHISLPYSIISAGHVEVAIKDTYCKRICGECTYEVWAKLNCNKNRWIKIKYLLALCPLMVFFPTEHWDPWRVQGESRCTA